ncbi:MAG: endonuclease [Spirochaetota bacterium]
MQKIYSRHRITLYCSCRFYKDKTIDRKSCGYVPRKESSRSQRIEWEHVVPAENFGRSFSAWREGHVKCQNSKGKNYKGRKCARKVEKSFRYMEADMYNLYPAIGELNMLRSNYSLYMVPGEKREFGKCDFEVEDRLAEPPENVRGDIARTYFYMNQVYPGHGIVGKNKRKLLQIWDKQDPVDAWECKRARKIRKLQGNTNHIVENRCKERGL